MTERFIDSNDHRSASDPTTPELLNELTAVDNQRDDIQQTAGRIDTTAVNRSIDVIRHDYDPSGVVVYRIKTLEGCIAVIETQLAILHNREAAIGKAKTEPQRVSDQSAQSLKEIYQQKKDIVREIRDLQMRQDSVANREKIFELKREKDFSLATRHERVLDVQIHADAEIERLNGILEVILADKDICLARLFEYKAEIHLLREKTERMSTALGKLANAMSEVESVADEMSDWSDVALPERLHDINMDSIGQPVSYGENAPFDLHVERTITQQSPQHPTNTLNFPNDIVSVEAHYEYAAPETIPQPASLEPLLREEAIKARRSMPAPKKGKGIKRLFKVN